VSYVCVRTRIGSLSLKNKNENKQRDGKRKKQNGTNFQRPWPAIAAVAVLRFPVIVTRTALLSH
jgi:hypothetical protein